MNSTARTFLDSFRNQVFIEKTSGEVVESTGEMSLWHSYTESKNLESVEFLSSTGSAEGVGILSGPLQPSVSYDFRVSLSQLGDLGLQATINGSTYQAAFEQETATLVTNWNDWSVSPTLTLSYLTEVIESFDGAEQRIAARDKPRLSVAYQIPLADEDRYGFEADFIDRTGLLFVPLWPLQVHIEGEHKEGESVLRLAGLNAYVASARHLMVFEYDKHELVESAGVRNGSLAVVRGLKNSYSPSARVIPVVVGRHSDSTDSLSLVDSLDFMTLKVDADEVLFVKPEPVIDFDTFHAGEVTETWGEGPDAYTEIQLVGERYVLPFRPDRSSDISIAMQRLRETFDPQTGARSVYERTQGAVRTFSFEYRFPSEQERQRFEDFVELHNGAQKEFYFEGPGKALDIVEHTGNLITVKNARLTRTSSSKAPGLSIKLYNEARVYRAIKSITKINEELEQIELNDTMPNDIDTIYPLFLGRFEGDNFTYTFETSEMSKITKTIKQLIYADSIENRRVIEPEQAD